MCYSAMVEQDIKLLETRFGSVIRRESWTEFENARHAADSQLPPLNERIFPGYYAPVVSIENGKKTARLMKYSIDPPEFIKDGKRFTTYNARRDNLDSPFWAECFQRHHGFIVIKEFYEWVSVKDLIKAGKVTMDTVKEEFEKQKMERKLRLKEAGKPYKPTKTELTAAPFRKVVIGFQPKELSELLVPVIFSKKTSPTGEVRYGFAIVTDDPPTEVSAAGHDRCPVFLKPESMEDWLLTGPLKTDQSLPKFDAVLTQRPQTLFVHGLAAA